MTTTMMERAGMGMSAMGMPGMAMPGMGMPTGMPVAAAPNANMMMVPRCTFKAEKCDGGMKLWCNCDDAMACTAMQSLCSMLSGGMCCCCMMMNGMMVGCCALTMGMCKCEMTEKGVCVTCTSGDARCSAMIQACCDYMTTMMKSGCSCCLMMGNTPVCCGGC